MYLENSLYSNIDLYLNDLNKYINDNFILNADYKSYDKQKDDDVTFIIFDIKSKLENNNRFIIKDFNYEGNLVFIYNKLLNQVIIKEIPFINYNNKIKLPIFTSDLAKILVDKLSKYIAKDNINIVFQNNLSVIAIDDNVKNIIPSIESTRNYKILNIILETINKEIKKIRQDVINQKSHYDRLERSKERAINKKRVILGINPLDYENEEEFNNALNEKLNEIYIKKYNKAKRHLELSQNKYKELLYKEKLYNYFKYILEIYVEANDNEIPVEYKDIIIETREEFKKYLIKNNKLDEDDIIYSFKVEDFFDKWNSKTNFLKKHKEKFIEAVYNFDLNNEFGALNTIKKIKKLVEDDIKLNNFNSHYTLDSDEMIKRFCIEIYNLKNCLLKEKDIINLKYHPIFYDKDIEYELESYNYDINDILKIIAPFYKSKEYRTGYNLLKQIPTLIDEENTYDKIIKNPKSAILDFRTFSTNWGNLINKPYWILNDIPHRISNFKDEDTYKLFMIKPRTKNVNLSNVIEINRGFRKKLLKGNFSEEKNILKIPNINGRIIITIPKSLNYSDINKILDNIKCDENYCNNINSINEDNDNDCINWLNIICEAYDTYLYVKSLLFKKIIKGEILPTRIYVNCDSEYYKNYLVNTPINYEYWHRYDYTNDYKYRRKYILDLKGYYNFARDYINNILKIDSSNQEYLKILYVLLFGSFTDNSKYKEYYDNFTKEIKEIENCILEDYDPIINNWFYKKLDNNQEEIKSLEKRIDKNDFSEDDLAF